MKMRVDTYFLVLVFVCVCSAMNIAIGVDKQNMVNVFIGGMLAGQALQFVCMTNWSGK